MKNINKVQIKRVILIILIIINCIVIFNFSAQKAEKSSDTSGRVVDVVINNLYKKKTPKEKESVRDTVTTIVRKTAHFSVYTCLGILTFLYTGTYKISYKKRFGFTMLFCFAYACSDELHQKFVDGRSSEFRDVCIDSCGAGFGSLVCLGISKIKNKFKK